MRLPTMLLLSTLLLPVPLFAQQPADLSARTEGPHDGGARPDAPWAADADGDGRITLTRILMKQRFWQFIKPAGISRFSSRWSKAICG